MLPRPVVIAAGLLLLASWLIAALRYIMPTWASVVLGTLIAIILGVWLCRRPPLVPRGRFLCDSCRYNYGDVCKRPERPNATRCPDYSPSGG